MSLKGTLLAVGATLLAFAIGFIIGDTRAPAQISAPGNTTTTVLQPLYPRTDNTIYTDVLLGYQMSVPPTWLNRYAVVENGESATFAFEAATSDGGTHTLDFSNVFTIYRLGLSAFSPAHCKDCTELKRNTKYVYAFSFDSQAKPLFPRLTPQSIRTDLTDFVAPSFRILSQ